jgi:hypothetical protein
MPEELKRAIYILQLSNHWAGFIVTYTYKTLVEWKGKSLSGSLGRTTGSTRVPI